MALKKYKPVTPGTRGKIGIDNQDLTKKKPEKSLTMSFGRKAGRNNLGRITVRHQGGGVKRVYRIIDFKRDKDGISGKVIAIEYDPYRSANIALIQYIDGEKRYIICPAKLKIGDSILSGTNIDIKVGNCLSLKEIPAGTQVHNIEFKAGKGGQIVRSAGSYAVLMAKKEDYATIKLPSGETRLININCRATIGDVGNSDHRNIRKGKAGCNRWRGVRPGVRGSVMNACDHPHGGGEGKAPIGHAGPLTPWGKPTLGYKTRQKKKPSTSFILKRRK